MKKKRRREILKRKMIVPAAAAAAAAAGTVDSTAWRDICVKMSDNTTTFHSTPCSFSG